MILAVPNIKAAEKWVLQSEKRTNRNKSAKSRLKTLFKVTVDSGEAASAGRVESAYDKAAAKGIIHPNKAARKKSRLAQALRRNAATPAKTAKGRSSRKK
ncbi:MAG TPA: 30S ribosomal protein S20 [Candidatus Cybelea sp.]|jgi:small subunit ribosomal protein S20|nr:30S ribosomal protein S20 [Candidatus Cybelea sp.]